MKKIIFIFLLSLTFMRVNAQRAGRSSYSVPVYSIHEPHFGFTGGLLSSSFYHSDAGDPGFQLGFQAGITYCMPLSKRISFEPQLLYSRKGAELDYAYTGYNHRSVNYRLHYLELPLQWNIHTNSIVDFIAGAYGSYLLDATYDVETSYSYRHEELNYGDFKKGDIGFIGGIGFNFPFSKISVKYAYGINDVSGNSSAYPYLAGARNNMITLSLTGYLR